MKVKQKVIAVCGVKNSGKTTLITKLVKELKNRGKKVAVIKYDGHDFECDIPGTDSYKIKQAGAYGTAVVSDYRIFIHKEVEKQRCEDLIECFPEADIIFIEGMKNSSLPKIEVIRKEISDKLVSNPIGRFLIVTDWEHERFEEETTDINDINYILKKIERII